MRLLAQAQITFSSTLCVQFGKGNEGSTVRFGQLNFRASVAAVKLDALDLLNSSDDDEKPAGSEEGYPVIEFRMVNDRANREKSEIWDATISGVVQVLKETPKDGEAAKASSKVTGGESTLDLEKVVYYVSDLMLCQLLDLASERFNRLYCICPADHFDSRLSSTLQPHLVRKTRVECRVAPFEKRIQRYDCTRWKVGRRYG
jgi:hypothetical protein